MYASVYAYGPRNHTPELVDSVLLEIYPDITTLTSQVDTETNVFRSLHVSMSVTALLLAIETREPYPRWTAVAAVLTGTIALATMALGIHWAVELPSRSVASLSRVLASQRSNAGDHTSGHSNTVRYSSNPNKGDRTQCDRYREISQSRSARYNSGIEKCRRETTVQ